MFKTKKIIPTDIQLDIKQGKNKWGGEWHLSTLKDQDNTGFP